MAIRIGILGAAKIAPAAVIRPAMDNPEFVIVAVGASDPARAKAYAAQHAIAQVADDYAALVHHPDVDLVYNALPPSHHAQWSIAALEAGKDVLCEKPFTMNASQILPMIEAANRTGRTLTEAFHYRHHTVMRRAVAILRSDAIGTIKEARASFEVPIAYREGELRWTRERGGGALMDLGCYPMHALRSVLGVEPSVVRATCILEHGVDVSTTAEFNFEGVRATLACSMTPERFGATLLVTGSNGSLQIQNFVAPQIGCAFDVTISGETRSEPTDGPTTYAAQLGQLGDVLLRKKQPLITLSDSLGNMRAIDAVYAAAGIDRAF